MLWVYLNYKILGFNLIVWILKLLYFFKDIDVREKFSLIIFLISFCVCFISPSSILILLNGVISFIRLIGWAQNLSILIMSVKCPVFRLNDSLYCSNTFFAVLIFLISFHKVGLNFVCYWFSKFLDGIIKSLFSARSEILI